MGYQGWKRIMSVTSSTIASDLTYLHEKVAGQGIYSQLAL